MATISGVNMMADEIRKSLPLSEEQWWRLNEVAATTESTATAGPTCGQPSWRALIRRIADGELEVRTVTTIAVTYSIGTNENDYTDDEAYHEYVPALVDRIEDEVTAYMKRHHPHVEFDTRRVPETESYSNRSYPYSANEPGYEIIEELDNFVGNNWPDWFNEAAADLAEELGE